MKVMIPTQAFLIGLIAWIGLVIFVVLAFTGCKDSVNHNREFIPPEPVVIPSLLCVYTEEQEVAVGCIAIPENTVGIITVDVITNDIPTFLSSKDNGDESILVVDGRYIFEVNGSGDDENIITFQLTQNGVDVAVCSVFVQDEGKDCEHRGHRHGHNKHKDCKHGKDKE